MPDPRPGDRARRTAAAGAAGAVLAVTLAGCGYGATPPAPGGESSPQAAQSAKEEMLFVEVTKTSVQPTLKEISTPVGSTLTINLVAERQGVLAVQTSPAQTFSFGPGKRTYTITLNTPGTVAIQEQVSDTLIAKVRVL